LQLLQLQHDNGDGQLLQLRSIDYLRARFGHSPARDRFRPTTAAGLRQTIVEKVKARVPIDGRGRGNGSAGGRRYRGPETIYGQHGSVAGGPSQRACPRNSRAGTEQPPPQFGTSGGRPIPLRNRWS